MRHQRREFLRLGAAAVAMPALSRLSFAQSAWPNRVIRMVVGFSLSPHATLTDN